MYSSRITSKNQRLVTLTFYDDFPKENQFFRVCMIWSGVQDYDVSTGSDNEFLSVSFCCIIV